MLNGVFDCVQSNRWILRLCLPLIGVLLSFIGCVGFGFVAAILCWITGPPRFSWIGSDHTDWRGSFVVAGLLSLATQWMFYTSSRWLSRKMKSLNYWDAILIANPFTCGLGLMLGFPFFSESLPTELRAGAGLLSFTGFVGYWNQSRLGMKIAEPWVAALHSFVFSAVFAGGGVWLAIRRASF
jgi:hypothetical protein